MIVSTAVIAVTQRAVAVERNLDGALEVEASHPIVARTASHGGRDGC